jgi:hypothetical protein
VPASSDVKQGIVEALDAVMSAANLNAADITYCLGSRFYMIKGGHTFERYVRAMGVTMTGMVTATEHGVTGRHSRFA